MELNREQIIKALEYCSSGGQCYKRSENDKNPFLSKEGCMAVQMRNAVAHIKQLTKENERLRAENDIYSNNVERIAENYHRQGRADTVREFAERLHKKFGDDSNRVFSNYNIHRYIDQIAKEMFGG